MILITGATGFLGFAVCRHLADLQIPYTTLQGRHDLDLRLSGNLLAALAPFDHPTVIHLAYPGTDGIGTSLHTPADLAHQVLQIDMHVIRECAQHGVNKLICIGSVCSYPEHVTFPTGEDQLFLGAPEAVNAAYGHAKRMQLALLEAYRIQLGLSYTQLVLANLYGPGDRSGHVIPATIRKILQAQQEDAPSITVWGDGTASREFLYVKDAAAAVVRAATDAPALNDYVNICSGQEITIRDLVWSLQHLIHYAGEVIWDASKPNGQPRRWFSNARAQQWLDWSPSTPFNLGLDATVQSMKGSQDV